MTITLESSTPHLITHFFSEPTVQHLRTDSCPTVGIKCVNAAKQEEMRFSTFLG